ncbi:MAG: RNA-binding protein [Microscillaceae bacterium]|nr:RNA-binding protein [Microscillaceae bacterium]MDW8459594.1 RNA-binding protein [Cytophagales bacterium]
MNIYVSNIAFSISEEELEQQFAEFGSVSSVKIIVDRETGRSKGFGFVEMDSDEEAHRAINGLNGKTLKGRDLQVKKAFPRKESSFESRGNGSYKKNSNSNYRSNGNSNFSKWK